MTPKADACPQLCTSVACDRIQTPWLDMQPSGMVCKDCHKLWGLLLGLWDDLLVPDHIPSRRRAGRCHGPRRRHRSPFSFAHLLCHDFHQGIADVLFLSFASAAGGTPRFLVSPLTRLLLLAACVLRHEVLLTVHRAFVCAFIFAAVVALFPAPKRPDPLKRRQSTPSILASDSLHCPGACRVLGFGRPPDKDRPGFGVATTWRKNEEQRNQNVPFENGCRMASGYGLCYQQAKPIHANVKIPSTGGSHYGGLVPIGPRLRRWRLTDGLICLK